MAKKNVNEKVSKSKPVHFSGLNLNQKVLAVVLIVLAIGVVAIAFPGEENITGGAIGDMLGREGMLGGIVTKLLGSADDLIDAFFGGNVFTGGKLIVYERFVLFLLLFVLLSNAAKIINLRGMSNVVVAGAISLISTWFIPYSVLAMIGLTYGTVYASVLILIPILTIGYVTWKIPKTKGGCIAKAVIFFILFIVLSMVNDSIGQTPTEYTGFPFTGSVVGPLGEWFDTFTDILTLALLIMSGYYLIRGLKMSKDDDNQAKEDWKKEKDADAAENSIAGIIVSKVEERIKGGASEARSRSAGSGGRGFTGGTGI